MDNPLIDLLRRCTVQLPGRGTGFFVAPRLILTCAHVLKGLKVDETIKVNRKSTSISVTIEALTSDDWPDLGLLRVDGAPSKAWVLLDSDLAQHDPVHAFGFPKHGGREQRTDGIAGRFEDFTWQRLAAEAAAEGWPDRPLIKFKDALVVGGYSGSALLNLRSGRVVGVVSETINGAAAVGGWAVPAAIALECLKDVADAQRDHRDGALAQWDKALKNYSLKTGLPILNFLPAKDLRAMAKNEALFTPEERALLVRTAWTRVFAQGRVPEKSFTEELHALNPEVKAVADKVAADYPKAKDANRRLLTMLRTPRMGILVNAPGIWEPITMTDDGGVTALDSFDHNDKNWWCPFEPDRQLGGLREDFDALTGMQRAQWSAKQLEPVMEPNAAATLAKKRESVLKRHPLVKDISWKEIKALSAMPSAPKLLTTAATKWGKAAAKDDTAAAEALAQAIRTTRYGCNWHGGHGPYSKAAYEVLHKKFGTTPWATQTPYWFDCVNFYNQTSTTGGKCPSPSWSKQEIPR